uniref:Uncharacterized protein n=1 Tax=Rhizophagus irregularis (strain DAOM 181602 / DAOM 197198 / MUCL 43194) TaxID=747089 RepID=U9TUP2_RHIID
MALNHQKFTNKRRRRVINKIHGSTFNVNTLSRLPLQITNDPFAVQLFSGASFR